MSRPWTDVPMRVVVTSWKSSVSVSTGVGVCPDVVFEDGEEVDSAEAAAVVVVGEELTTLAHPARSSATARAEEATRVVRVRECVRLTAFLEAR